jgi:hypothetical protein
MSTALPPRRLLGAAVALGFVNALWALFQWAELLLARQGGTPFCSIDETFNCAQVWDSALAVTIHDVTQIPIAGWGLIWGLVATLVPLWGLVDDRALGRGGSAALRLTALAGIASVGAFATASALSGALCIGCIGTYFGVGIWAVLAWKASSADGFVEAPRGAAIAAALVALGFAILVVPGMRTPHAKDGKLALPTKPTDTKPSTPSTSTPAPATPGAPGPFDGPGSGDAARDELLDAFIASLDAPSRQLMSDLLRDVRDAKAVELKPGRHTAIGDKDAPVKIIEWTDPLCPHCAQLHEVLAEIQRTVPPGLFSVESRQFPLDGFCNSGVQRKTEDGVRCFGAKAQICMEGDPKDFEASGALFAARAQTVDAVFAAFAPFTDVKKLKACVEDPKTQAALNDDISAALGLDLKGTPLVYLNGKEVPPFPPLVYSLILTGGKVTHSAFKSLPAPRPPQPEGAGHEGHNH